MKLEVLYERIVIIEYCAFQTENGFSHISLPRNTFGSLDLGRERGRNARAVQCTLTATNRILYIHVWFLLSADRRRRADGFDRESSE